MGALSGKDDDTHTLVVACPGKCVLHFLHGQRAKRITHFGTIDGHFGDPLRIRVRHSGVVTDVGVVPC